jgi:hypothetical protein
MVGGEAKRSKVRFRVERHLEKGKARATTKEKWKKAGQGLGGVWQCRV